MIRILLNLSSVETTSEVIKYSLARCWYMILLAVPTRKRLVLLVLKKAFDYRELPNNPQRYISAVFLKNHVMQSLKQLFGEEGANCSVDLLKYNCLSKRFLLRCEDKDYVRLRSSLTLASTYDDDTCRYTVHKASASPFGLLSDGRAYLH